MASHYTLSIFIFTFSNLSNAQNWKSAIQFEGVVLEQHNLWRSLIANGNIDDQPSGSNVEKLIWDYQIQELAQQFTEKCDANKRPSFDNDKLNNLSFSFE